MTRTPPVFILGADRFGAQCFRLERDPVVRRVHCAEFPADLSDMLHARVAVAKQIEIAGGTVGRLRPRAEEHRSLQYKTIPVSRNTEPEKQPLDGIAGQNELHIFGIGASALGQPVANGRANVARPLARRPFHCIASR